MKVWETLVQIQVRFNRVPVKVPVKVWAALVQSQVRFNGFRRRLRKRRFWESLVQGQVRCNRFSRGFPALGFAARFRKTLKNKTSRLLGIPPKLIFDIAFLLLTTLGERRLLHRGGFRLLDSIDFATLQQPVAAFRLHLANPPLRLPPYPSPASFRTSPLVSSIVLYCIVLYCIVLYCIVLYCIVLYCIVLYCIVCYCIVCIVLYCIVLYCIVLYSTVLYCIVLYCIVFVLVLYCIVVY